MRGTRRSEGVRERAEKSIPLVQQGIDLSQVPLTETERSRWIEGVFGGGLTGLAGDLDVEGEGKGRPSDSF